MAMTVLPSFQAFLASTAQIGQPLSPLRVQSPSPSLYLTPLHVLMQSQQQQQQLQQHAQCGYESPLSVAPRSSAALLLSPVAWKANQSIGSFAHTTHLPRSSSDYDSNSNNTTAMHQHERSASATPSMRWRVGLSANAVSSPTSASCVAQPSTTQRNKKKYLKERERCAIVRRVRAGEKQAHLAKEFGVSRAAVCYLLKHQVEILSRSAERL